MNDQVNHPSHYKTFPDMEAIDIIEASLTPEEYIGYLKGSFLKYRLRAGDKGPALVDIDKSNWYREELRNCSATEERTQKLLSEAAQHTREIMRGYCQSERYEVTPEEDEAWNAVDFGKNKACPHTTWHYYQSVHRKICTECGHSEDWNGAS